MGRRKPGDMVPLAIPVILFLVLAPCTAAEPSWTFKYGERTVGGLAVAPDGSDLVAVTGKVLLISRNGTVLSNEPFGESLVVSRDGSTIATAYSSNVASTVYLFRKSSARGGGASLRKVWEATESERVTSFAVSDKGERVAISNGGKGIDVLNGESGAHLGDSDEYSPLIAISGNGYTIAGISSVEGGLRVYSSKGVLQENYDLSLPGTPTAFLMTDTGDRVIFNAGPRIMAFNTSDGSEIWVNETSGDVGALAMTPSGSAIIAGTGNGTIGMYDAGGNLSWTYYPDAMGTRDVRALAITPDASRILAGTAGGQVLLLDASGTPVWIYQTNHDPVTHVAIADDGSLAAAAGEQTIYAFALDEPVIPMDGPEVSLPIPGNPSAGPSTGSPVRTTNDQVHSRTSLNAPDTRTPQVTSTEFSVIRKATQSPLDFPVGIAAILLGVFLVRQRRK